MKTTTSSLLLLSLAVLVRPTLAAPRETRVALTCANVSEPEVRKLLTHYCRDFKVVTEKSDYTLMLTKTDDANLPYMFVVVDSVDGEAVEASSRSQLPGAIKDACSAMHIRFGEAQPESK